VADAAHPNFKVPLDTEAHRSRDVRGARTGATTAGCRSTIALQSSRAWWYPSCLATARDLLVDKPEVLTAQVS
jgi:hypothetical protein